MSTLRDAIADYLKLRRALGFKLAGHGRLLTSFADYLDQAEIPTITTAAAVAFATQPQGVQPIRWTARLCVIRGFARYLSTLDPLTEVPPADLMGYRRQRRTPYLFAPAEITALLAAAVQLRLPMQALTYPALLGLIANAGLRVSEAIHLDEDDADLTAGLLTIRNTKFGKSRQLPLHSSTVAALGRYAQTREWLCPRRRVASFFVSSTGTRLVDTNVRAVFHKLIGSTGIGSGADSSPRIHDLRHSFAVATLLGWYRDGGDVAARIPLLSAYLGHVSPASTYWYLQAAPELLTLASERLDHSGEATR
jgi:integrase/recombinase XerD